MFEICSSSFSDSKVVPSFAFCFNLFSHSVQMVFCESTLCLRPQCSLRNSLVVHCQDQMLTKEEVLENWNMFVGSQATNYGEDLTRNHDELWGSGTAWRVGLCVCGWEEGCWTWRPPLHPLIIIMGHMSVYWIVKEHWRRGGGGTRVRPTTNTKGPSQFCIDSSVSDIQEQSWTQWTYFRSMVPSSRPAGFTASEIRVDSL